MNGARDAEISGLGVPSKLDLSNGTWHISNADEASCLKPSFGTQASFTSNAATDNRQQMSKTVVKPQVLPKGALIMTLLALATMIVSFIIMMGITDISPTNGRRRSLLLPMRFRFWC